MRRLMALSFPPAHLWRQGKTKKIQHLEGGIIKDILVKEGDLVTSGQPVLRIDDTSVKARLRRLALRNYRLTAMRSRLLVESKERERIILPATLTALIANADVREIVARQRNELSTRKQKLTAETRVLEKEISGLKETVTGYKAQLNATRVQITYFAEELKGKNSLVRRGLVRKTEVLDVRRAHARLIGEQGLLLGRIAESRQRVARADQQIAHLRFSAVQAAVEELRKTETELYDVKEQIRAAEDVVKRVEVLSPVRGIVVKLNYHTAGGVIAPGADILELLPINDELIIETRITPGNITHVEQGQLAQVRLSALNQRLVPMIDAKVSYVSADAVIDREMRNTPGQVSGQGVFIVRVELDTDDIKTKAPDFRGYSWHAGRSLYQDRRAHLLQLSVASHPR